MCLVSYEGEEERIGDGGGGGGRNLGALEGR